MFCPPTGVQPLDPLHVRVHCIFQQNAGDDDVDDDDDDDAVAKEDKDEEADMPPLEHLEPLRDVTDEAAADMPPLEPLDDVPLSLRSLR